MSCPFSVRKNPDEDELQSGGGDAMPWWGWLLIALFAILLCGLFIYQFATGQPSYAGQANTSPLDVTGAAFQGSGHNLDDLMELGGNSIAQQMGVGTEAL